MKNFSWNKRSLILTTFSAVMVLPTINVSAQNILVAEKAVNSPDLIKSNLAVDNDSEVLFSSLSRDKSLVQRLKGRGRTAATEIVLDLGLEASNNNSEGKSVNTGLKKDKQQKQNSSGLFSVANQVSIITPQAGTVNAGSTNISIQHYSSARVKVTVNGKPIDKDISSYLHKDEGQKLYTRIWYNVPLSKGENIITAKTKKGNPVSVKVFVRENKARVSINPVGEARVPADGRSNIDFEGKITDKNGKLIKKDTVISLGSNAGKFIGVDYKPDAPGFQVLARGGQFSASLQAGDKAGSVKVTADIYQKNSQNTSNNFDSGAVTFIEFTTNLRPSLATGVVNLRIGAGGTDYYGSFRDFLNPEEIDKDTVVDLDAGVFATGKIGEWLFTGAYNSDRPLNEDCNGDNRLFGGIQSCEKQYPVYGDDSTVTSTAPSIDNVYARMERSSGIRGAEPDYFMWGDYNTQEFARESQL